MGSGVELWASGICWKIRCECYKQAKREQIVPSGNPIDSVRWQSGRIGPDWKIEVTEFSNHFNSRLYGNRLGQSGRIGPDWKIEVTSKPRSRFLAASMPHAGSGGQIGPTSDRPRKASGDGALFLGRGSSYLFGVAEVNTNCVHFVGRTGAVFHMTCHHIYLT